MAHKDKWHYQMHIPSINYIMTGNQCSRMCWMETGLNATLKSNGFKDRVLSKCIGSCELTIKCFKNNELVDEFGTTIEDGVCPEFVTYIAHNYDPNIHRFIDSCVVN